MIDTFTLFQLICGLCLCMYCVFPVHTPLFLASYIVSIYGLLVSCILIFLFFRYTHPFLGILFIIVSYVAFQRAYAQIERASHSHHHVDIELQEMNTPPVTSPDTLEEYIVQKMTSPVATPVYIYTQFKPVNDDIGSATLL